MVGDTALHRPQGLSASPGHNPASSVWPAVFLLLLMSTSSIQEVTLSATAKASSAGEEGHGDDCCSTALLDVGISPVLCSGTLNHWGS